MYFVPLGIKSWLVSKGISAGRIHEMDWWEQQELFLDGQKVSIVATPSQHFSGRGLFGRNKTLWASWSIAWGGFHTWFGGDTGYNGTQFKEMRRRLPPIDLGIIPIGAYEPQSIMGPIHVNPAEAVQIHQDLGAKASLAIHWGAFILSAEGVLTPIQALESARVQAKLAPEEFAHFKVGESRNYPVTSMPAVASDIPR